MRLIRTNLSEKDVQPVKEQLAQSLFDHIPVGVGSKGIIPIGAQQFEVGFFFKINCRKFIMIPGFFEKALLINMNRTIN